MVVQLCFQTRNLSILEERCKKYGLYTHIRFETQVQKLTWDENQRKWIVSLRHKNFKIEEEVFDVMYVHRQ